MKNHLCLLREGLMSRKLYLHLYFNGLLSESWELTQSEFNAMNKAKRKAYTNYREKRKLKLFSDKVNESE
jgi:hypothetical protein